MASNDNTCELVERAVADLRHVLSNALEMQAGDDKSRRRLADANVVTMERVQRTLADLHSNTATETVNENDPRTVDEKKETGCLEISGQIVTVAQLQEALEFIRMRRLFPSD